MQIIKAETGAVGGYKDKDGNWVELPVLDDSLLGSAKKEPVAGGSFSKKDLDDLLSLIKSK